MFKTAPPTLDISILIGAPPAVVCGAFFDPEGLKAWRRAVRSVTIPRVLGPFVIEWPTGTDPDAILGPLGGVFRGTIMQIDEDRGFFVADAYWLPPEGNPIGPMALEIACEIEAESNGEITTRLRVTQNGFEESARWRRYYEVSEGAWTRALNALKARLERHTESRDRAIGVRAIEGE